MEKGNNGSDRSNVLYITTLENKVADVDHIIILGSYDSREEALNAIDNNVRLLQKHPFGLLSLYEVPMNQYLIQQYGNEDEKIKKLRNNDSVNLKWW